MVFHIMLNVILGLVFCLGRWGKALIVIEYLMSIVLRSIMVTHNRNGTPSLTLEEGSDKSRPVSYYKCTLY